MEITEIVNGICEASMTGLCVLLLCLVTIFSFTAGKEWKIIREQDKIIQRLEFQAIEREELLKILNIKLN